MSKKKTGFITLLIQIEYLSREHGNTLVYGSILIIN